MQATYQSLSESILSNLRGVKEDGISTDPERKGVVEEYRLRLEEKISSVRSVDSKEAAIEM